MIVSPRLKGILQVILIFVVLILGIAANFLLSRSGSGPGRVATGPDAVLVAVIQPGTTETTVQIRENGVVQSRNTIGLTPQVSGQVVEVSRNLVSGGVFSAGEVLFRLDPEDYKANVDQARADVSSARANLMVERAEADIATREWDLVYPNQPIPDLVARKPQISQAEAALESALARLRTAELNLERVAFTLPFAGRMVQTSVELGQRLSANQTYGQAYSLESVEVSVSLNPELLSLMEPLAGRRAVVRLPGTRQTQEYTAFVSRVEAELDQATRLGRVILRFDEPNSLIPGAFVTVEIFGPTVENAFLIPEQAMSEARYVWIVKAGRLASQSLEFLSLPESDNLIVAPFDTGEGIVISPLVDPTESMPVRVVQAENNR